MEVNAATRRAWLRFDPSAAKLSAVLGAIRAVGYRARPLEEGVAEDVERGERRAILRRLWVAGLGMMQVMMYAVPAYMASDGEITPDVEASCAGQGSRSPRR
jgi:Cu2+-exporting ATPase